MDVYAPATPGPWPLVLLVPGGPQPPGAYTYLDPAAFAIAARGVVAMTVAWRQGPAFGAGYPASFGDVACAIGVARRLAPAYGARPDRLVLAGHSLGGWAGAVLALAPAPVTPAPGECGPTAGSPRPDALVTLSGAVHEVRRPGERAYLAAFFGGDRARRAAAWRAADPLALAGSPGARPRVPVTVVAGGRDTVVPASVARSFLAALRAAGHPARLVGVPGADHLGVLTAAPAVDAVVAAARRPSP
jgi:acetyl esterase/lipase